MKPISMKGWEKIKIQMAVKDKQDELIKYSVVFIGSYLLFKIIISLI